MFISPAYAADTAGTAALSGGSGLMSVLPLFVILIVFYFMVIRPQNARIREHRALIDGLKKGDKIVTGGGIIATVVKAAEKSEDVTVKLGDGVEVKILRNTILSLYNPSPDREQKIKDAK